MMLVTNTFLGDPDSNKVVHGLAELSLPQRSLVK
jgi:hypothetical protein